MRILIDGGCWTNNRGYGRFTRELLKALARKPRHDYTVLIERSAQADFSLPLRAVTVDPSRPIRQAASSSSHRSARDILTMSRAVAAQKPDAVFFPSVYSYFPLIGPARALIGIHDTMADRFPQYAFNSPGQRRFWRWKTRLALWQCRDILTVSNYSRQSIVSYWKVPADRVRVIPEAPAGVFHQLQVERRDIILAVGGISPNKNLDTLIRAFARIGRPCELVIVGDYESDGFKSCYEELQPLAAGLPVRFTGWVSDEALCRLYSEARVLAFPSLEEGFGLPAVEAMACGLPIVAHGAHAVAEVVGDAGLLVDARNAGQLAEALERVLNDADLAAAMSRKGLERAQGFSWDRAADQLQDIFDSIWT